MAAIVAEQVGKVRHDWSLAEVQALFALPFGDLIYDAQRVHQLHFDPNRVQASTLLSIKTGACPEDCGCCPQSLHHDTGLAREALLPVAAVAAAALSAKAAGATRFFMGAAWRPPKDRDLPTVTAMIGEVRALGLESCATLGMLTAAQAAALAAAGRDYYNHNLDTSPEFYGQVVSARSYQDRLDRLGHVRDAALKVCCGGILGMREGRTDRARLLQVLATLPAHPDSVPVNQLLQVEGTPLAGSAPLDPFEFVRTIAVARILMPRARAPVGRPRVDERRAAGAVLPGRRQLDFSRRAAADHAEPGLRARSRAVRPPRARARRARRSHRRRCRGARRPHGARVSGGNRRPRHA